jgi:hypothetical protein
MENEKQDVAEESDPSEMKEETTNNRLRIMDVEALTILRTSAHRSEKQDNGDKPGLTGTLWGNRLGRATLRRE